MKNMTNMKEWGRILIILNSKRNMKEYEEYEEYEGMGSNIKNTT